MDDRMRKSDSPAELAWRYGPPAKIPRTDVETEDEGFHHGRPARVSLCLRPPLITHVRRMLNRHEAPFNRGHVFDPPASRVLGDGWWETPVGVFTESSSSRLVFEAVLSL
jgi:hypothetical protein